MPETTRSGVRIWYGTAGAGDPLVLVHGFSANARTNWVMPGCVAALRPHFRLVAPDLRGHGRSAKPVRQRDYSIDTLASDVLAVMDAEGVERAHIAGYSMGGMVTLKLLLDHPERIRGAVVGGMGASFPQSPQEWSGGAIEPGGRPGGRRRLSGRFLRAYFGHMHPLAMLATYRGVLRDRHPIPDERLSEIRAPVLCIAGTRDHLSGAARDLADRIPGARLVLLDGQSHLSAPHDRRFSEAIASFLSAAG